MAEPNPALLGVNRAWFNVPLALYSLFRIVAGALGLANCMELARALITTALKAL